MLYIYKDKTPNTQTGTHYMFDNIDNYLQTLGTPFMQFELNDYRINNNQLFIKTPSLLADVDALTYAIDIREEGSTKYYKCYFIDDSMIQSSAILCNITVDLWGSYIAKSTFDKIHVTRCNRNIANGTFDDIPITSNDVFVDEVGTIDINNVGVLFVASKGGFVGLFPSDNPAMYTMQLFVAPLSRWGSIEPEKRLDHVINAVANIYQYNTYITETPIGYAKVQRAYIVKLDKISYSTEYDEFYSRSVSSIYGFHVNISSKSENLQINTSIDREQYFGTRFDYLKLPRLTYTNNINVHIDYITKQDGFQVILSCGNAQKDITSSFAIGLNVPDQQAEISNLTRQIQLFTSVGSGVASLIAGNVYGAIPAISSLITAGTQQENGKYIPGGDGIVTFRRLNGMPKPPFAIISRNSYRNESKHVRLNGANFDYYADNFNEIFQGSLLGSSFLEFTDTYIIAEVDVEGVPTNARTFIERTFAEGVYVEKI